MKLYEVLTFIQNHYLLSHWLLRQQDIKATLFGFKHKNKLSPVCLYPFFQQFLLILSSSLSLSLSLYTAIYCQQPLSCGVEGESSATKACQRRCFYLDPIAHLIFHSKKVHKHASQSCACLTRDPEPLILSCFIWQGEDDGTQVLISMLKKR